MREEYKEDKKAKKQNKKQAKKNAMFRKLRKYAKDKYDKEIVKKEKKLGRELDRKEKTKIIEKIINSVGIQAMASRTAVSSAFTGPKISTLALPEAKIVKEEQVKEEKAIEKQEQEQEKEIVVARIEKSAEQEKVESEIDNIENAEETQDWLKNLYIQKYEEVGGKTKKTTPLEIDIVKQDVDKIYKTVDGNYVTTINQKEAAENILDKKGIKYESILAGKVYMAVNIENGKIIDCANKIDDQFHKVTVIEKNKKENNKKSVLEELGGITPTAFYLMDLYKQQDEYKEKYNKINPIIDIKINDAKRILKGRYSNTF